MRGPFNAPCPAAVMVPAAEDAQDNSRRHRAFIQDAFPAGDTFQHIDLPQPDEGGPGGTALDDTRLQALASASVLLYTDQSRLWYGRCPERLLSLMTGGGIYPLLEAQDMITLRAAS